MTFLNPWGLLALAGVAVPIVLHLLTRRTPRVVEFSNVALLHRLERSAARRLRLRQLLLLLLRCLAALLLALAFARPVYAPGAQALGARTAVAQFLLVDTSLSTSYETNSGSVFNRIKAHAKALAAAASAQDRVFLAGFGSGIGPFREVSGGDASRSTRVLEGLEPGLEGTDLRPALEGALSFLERVDAPRKEFVLMTDLTRPPWEAFGDPLTQVAPGVPIFVLAPRVRAPQNIGLAAVSVPDQVIGIGRPMWVDATVHNYGSEATEGVLMELFADGVRTRATTVALRPHAEQTHRFTFVPETGEGPLVGEVRLGDDRLREDNGRYFAVARPRSQTVLLTGAMPSDAAFLRRALDPGSSDAPFEIQEVEAAALKTDAVGAADVIVLAGAPTLSPDQIDAIDAAVDGGAGLWVTLGPKADLRALAELFDRGVLPALPSRPRGAPGRTSAFFSVESLEAAHPLFAGLERDGVVQAPRVFFAYEARVAPGARNALALRDGTPLLLTGRHGRGRSAVLLTGLDLAWSDLAVRGLFVPLVHRLVGYLRFGVLRPPATVVGEDASGLFESWRSDLIVSYVGPRGERGDVPLLPTPEGYRWQLDAVASPGLWTLHSGDRTVAQVVANVDPAESDLTPMPQAAVAQLLGPDRTSFLDPGEPLAPQLRRSREGTELWQPFVALALIFLAAEMAVQRTRSTAEGHHRGGLA